MAKRVERCRRETRKAREWWQVGAILLANTISADELDALELRARMILRALMCRYRRTGGDAGDRQFPTICDHWGAA